MPATLSKNHNGFHLSDIPIMPAVATVGRFVRNVAVKIGRTLVNAAEAIAEARMQRARIEADLYLNRFRHSSKNDDDLPAIR